VSHLTRGIFIFSDKSQWVAQANLRLLGARDRFARVPQVAGSKGIYDYSQLRVPFEL
jgi:hypothetical protein